MFFVYNNYKEAVRRGSKGSFLVKRKFTWKKSAERLVEIMGGRI